MYFYSINNKKNNFDMYEDCTFLTQHKKIKFILQITKIIINNSKNILDIL